MPRYEADGTFEGYVGGCLDIHSQKEAAEKVRIADETVCLMKIQDEERRRIARELHDSAGQTLTVLGLSLAQLVQKAEGIAPELAIDGKKIEEIVQQLHREIRTTSYLLHPPLLDECGLPSALNWYVEGLSRSSGIAINLDVADNVGRLPNDMELAVFRLVQECLTNIHRQGSKTADIRVFPKGRSLRVGVTDEGKGIPPERLRRGPPEAASARSAVRRSDFSALTMTPPPAANVSKRACCSEESLGRLAGITSTLNRSKGTPLSRCVSTLVSKKTLCFRNSFASGLCGSADITAIRAAGSVS